MTERNDELLKENRAAFHKWVDDLFDFFEDNDGDKAMFLIGWMLRKLQIHGRYAQYLISVFGSRGLEMPKANADKESVSIPKEPTAEIPSWLKTMLDGADKSEEKYGYHG